MYDFKNGFLCHFTKRKLIKIISQQLKIRKIRITYMEIKQIKLWKQTRFEVL